MPLQDNQREFIKYATQHLISDLPKEEKALQVAVENLHKAFTNLLPKNHEFYFLQKCIHKPWLYLRRIEELNEDITIGEIQKYLFDLVNQAIETTANQADINLANLAWNSNNSLLDQLNQNQDYSKKLISKPLPVHDDTPLYALHLIERMFTATLVPDFLFQKVHLNISININPEKNLVIFLEDFPDIEDNDPNGFQFDSFMENLQSKALSIAEKEVKYILLNYLISQHKIHEDQKLSDGAKLILTHKYFFNLILNDQNRINSTVISLKSISRKQLAILTDPISITLLMSKKCSLNQAKNFTENNCYNLKFPFIFNLIQSNILNVTQGMNASQGAKKLLTNEFFYNQIKQNKILFDEIKNTSIELSEYLCSNQLIELFRENLIQINLITLSSAKLLHDNPIILFLYTQNLINITELRHLNANSSDPFIYNTKQLEQFDRNKTKLLIKAFINLAENDLLEPSDLSTLFDCLEEFCSYHIQNKNQAIKILLSNEEIKHVIHVNLIIRLQTLLDEKPFKLADNTLDTFERLRADTREFSIDLPNLIDKEIARRTRVVLLGVNANALTPIFTHQYKLMISTSEIWGHHFAQRIFAIYLRGPYKINNLNDNIEKIIQEIHEKESALSLLNLSQACMKNFLSLLKDDISPILETRPAPAIYQKIYDEIANAFDKTHDRRGRENFFNRWRHAFQQILSFTQEEMRHRKTSSPQAKRARTTYSLGLFVRLPSGVEDFCTRIQSIASISYTRRHAQRVRFSV